MPRGMLAAETRLNFNTELYGDPLRNKNFEKMHPREDKKIGPKPDFHEPMFSND